MADKITTRLQCRHTATQLGRMPPVVGIQESNEWGRRLQECQVARCSNNALIIEVNDLNAGVSNFSNHILCVIR